MRRLVLLALVVGVLVAMALPALAGRPTCGDDPPPPWCDTTTTTSSTTTTTTTTTTTVPDELEACSDIMEISGKGNATFSCLWTPDRGDSEDPPPVATVTITNLDRGVKEPPYVFVRDDSPGDICVLEQDWVDQTRPPYTASFDLVYGPAETLPEGYDAWANSTYWDFVNDDAPHWCAPQDPVLDSLRYDHNGSALHFQVGFNARGGGSFTVTLSPGQSQD